MDVLIVVGLVVWLIAQMNSKAKAKTGASQAEKRRAPQGEWQKMLGQFSEAAQQIGESVKSAQEKKPDAHAPDEKKHRAKEAAVPQMREIVRERAETRVIDRMGTGRMQPRVVSQVEMERAGEGEDPCHDDYVQPVYMPAEAMNGEYREESEAAQELLRGIVLSEILLKPQDRRRMRMR